MEKISSYVSKRLPPLKIYLDDIEDIYNILHKHTKKVEIHYGGYNLSLEELKSNYSGGCGGKIEVVSEEPCVSVNMSGNGSHIYCYSNDIVSAGLATEIEDTLLKRKYKLKSLLLLKYPPSLSIYLH